MIHKDDVYLAIATFLASDNCTSDDVTLFQHSFAFEYQHNSFAKFSSPTITGVAQTARATEICLHILEQADYHFMMKNETQHIKFDYSSMPFNCEDDDVAVCCTAINPNQACMK